MQQLISNIHDYLGKELFQEHTYKHYLARRPFSLQKDWLKIKEYVSERNSQRNSLSGNWLNY